MPSQFPKFPLITDTQKKTHPGKGNKKKNWVLQNLHHAFFCLEKELSLKKNITSTTSIYFHLLLEVTPGLAFNELPEKTKRPGDPKEQGEAEADDETRPRRVEFGHDLICRPADFAIFQTCCRKGWTHVCGVVLFIKYYTQYETRQIPPVSGAP